MALASGPAGHSTVCSPQIISRSQCTGMRLISCTWALVLPWTSGSTSAVGEVAAGGRYAGCIMINGSRARGVEEQLDVRTDILEVVIKVDRRCCNEDMYRSGLN
jgi:hypothetical protein